MEDDVIKEMILTKLDSVISRLDGIYLKYHLNPDEYLDLRDSLVEVEKDVKEY